MALEMTTSERHYMILLHLLEKGYAPDLATIASHFGESNLRRAKSVLMELEEQHGVVLHPDKESVWIIHPLSTAPTNFCIGAKGMTYWGNCAWCSLGAAALLQPNHITIATTCGAEGESVKLEIINGQVTPTDYLIHFPVPMTRAWDNVVYTCSVMLVFKSEPEITVGANDTRSRKETWKQSTVFGTLPKPGTGTIFQGLRRSGPKKKPRNYFKLINLADPFGQFP